MPKVIVPVGFDSGPVWPLEPADQPTCYEVLLGDGSLQLTEDAYLVWATAMLDRQAHAEVRFNRADLLKLTTGDERIPDPEVMIEKLLNSKILVEYDPDDPARFLQDYKLHLLAEGSGNTKEHPDTFRLSRRGEVVLELYHDAYAMLRGMPYVSSMSVEIQTYSKALPTDGTFTLDELSVMFARAVPSIVATRCGYLQPS
ncbi:hypothetical protein [Fodinicola feengrottensis]|nr:hypothetical protein [Fodinicola feengrottensis]